MKTRSFVIATAILALLAFLGAGIAPLAAAEEEMAKSGTLTMKGWKVAFIGSAGQSKGVLTYEGKKRKYKMTGLGIGGLGISSSEATGIVYNMKTMDDFVGSYTSARSGVTLGDDELLKDRMLWMQNQKGVRIKLTTNKEGVELNLGADGTVISWDD
jgi:hypothetical protein